MIRYSILAVGIATASGCSMMPSVSKPEVTQAPKSPPVVVTQSLTDRNVYTGAAPYVLCYGRACDEPTPKSLIPAGPVRLRQSLSTAPVGAQPPKPLPVKFEPEPEKVALKVTKEVRIRESVRYRFNSIAITPEGEGAIQRLVDQGKQAKEVLVDGYAGMTTSNESKEAKLLELAIGRARDTAIRLKQGGMTASIQTQARLDRCQSEADCLRRHKFGGRRSDVEVVIITGDAN